MSSRQSPLDDGGAPRERKRAQSRSRLQADLLAFVEQALYATDPEGRVVYWNRAAADLFGSATGEVLDRPLWRWGGSAAIRRRVDEIRQTLQAGRRWSGELHLYRADGTTFPALLTTAPTHDAAGVLTGYVGAVTDLSDRYHIEEAIDTSEERLRLALEAASVGTWDWDLQRGSLQWSEHMWRLYGVTPDIFECTPEAALELVVPADREHFRQHVRMALQRGEFNCEYRIVHPDGSLRWLHGKGQVRFNRDGQPERFLGAVRDFTERKQVEKALHEALRQLQENHAHLVHAEKMASLGQLAAGVAHEINNPIGFILSNLGVLSGYTQTVRALLEATGDLLDGAPDACTRDAVLARIRTLREDEDFDFILEDIDHLVAESQEGSQRVKEIVQSLKRFARTDDTSMKWADLNEGLQATLRMLRHELKHKAEVHEDLQPLPELHCNPGQLNQVFMNLLVNAAQAIEGRGTICVATEATESEITVRVSDTGQGISPTHLSKLFNPFFTTKPVGQGSGLGLSIAYGIVKRHGGHIEVESEVGRGTTFAIHLPLSERDSD